MKTHWACTGMLSPENDHFKFLKTAKNIKSMCITCTVVPGLQTSMSLTRNINVKVAIELYSGWEYFYFDIL